MPSRKPPPSEGDEADRRFREWLQSERQRPADDPYWPDPVGPGPVLRLGGPPTIDDVPRLIIAARPTLRHQLDDPEGCKTRRDKAVRDLLTLARQAVAKANETEPRPPEGYSRLKAMPVQLRAYLEVEGLQILLADDPVAALRRFLGQRGRGRGRPPAANEDRDLKIAVAVAERIFGGMTTEAACEAVEKEAAVGFEMVRKIYYERRRAAYFWLCLQPNGDRSHANPASGG